MRRPKAHTAIYILQKVFRHKGDNTGQVRTAPRTSSHFVGWQEVILFHGDPLLLLEQGSS